jgi:hypothetical protein
MAGNEPIGPTDAATGTGAIEPVRAQFIADPAIPAGSEAYICYSFPVEGLDGLQLAGVTWRPPTGPVILHHASLFGAAGLPDIGEVPCDPMPERVAALGVYTPGGGALSLPPGVAISLPKGTGRLIVLAHVRRVADGEAQPTSLELDVAREPLEHVVNWVDIFAPVPIMGPHQSMSSVGQCEFGQRAHVVTVWPHMHRFGKQFHGTIIRTDGSREPLFDIESWDFDHQLTYPVDAQLEAGDRVETQCEWDNPTMYTVLPGPYSTDEMCNQGLFVWPFESAACTSR